VAETSRSRPRPGPSGTTSRRAAESAAGGGELPDRVLEGLERATTQLPASVPTQSVRAIRQGQLVKVINEAVAPERARMEAEQARWRTRVAELEGELLALRDARRRMEQAKDATRTVELPRLAALVDAERTKGEQLAAEREGMRARVAELEQAVVQREERLRETSAAEAALRMALDALHEPASGASGPRAGEEADARVRELGERLETLSAAVRRGALPAAEAGRGAPGADPTAVAELARASEARARRIATLERAVAELGGALVAAEGGEGGASAVALAATLELLREAQAREGRLEAHVAALVETQQLAQAALAEEGRRRAGLEESLQAALARLSSLEAAAHARVTRSFARGGASPPAVAALGPGLGEQLDDLRESLSLEARRRADEVEGQVGRLGQATRAALERMAAVLDRALAAGLVGSPPDLVARSASAVEAASRREPRPGPRPRPQAEDSDEQPAPPRESPATRTARPWRAAEEVETREWSEGPGSPSASSASQARLRPTRAARPDAPEPAPRRMGPETDGSSTQAPFPDPPAVRLERGRVGDDRPTAANPAPALPLPAPPPARRRPEHATEVSEPADFLEELVDDEPERPIQAEVESWFRPGRPGQSPSEVEAEQLAEFGHPPYVAPPAQAWLDAEDEPVDGDDTGLEGEEDELGPPDAPSPRDRPSGSYERPVVDDAEAALWRELGGSPDDRRT
jgi:hypothetical protein